MSAPLPAEIAELLDLIWGDDPKELAKQTAAVEETLDVGRRDVMVPIVVGALTARSHGADELEQWAAMFMKATQVIWK